METKIKVQGDRTRNLVLVPEPVPENLAKGPQPSKYDALVREFWDRGYPSARVQASWDMPAVGLKRQIARAKGLAVALRKVARRLDLPLQVVARGIEVYLVREGE